MEKITKEMLKKYNLGDRSQGVILMKTLQKCIAKTSNKPYIKGVLHSEDDFPFIVWNSSTPFSLLNDYLEDFSNRVVEIEFEIIDFAGSKTASLSKVRPIEGIDPDVFIKVIYPTKQYQEAFLKLTKEHLSPEGYKLFVDILEVDTGADSIWEMFSVEYAASTHHDNCKTGLLAHTYRGLLLLIRLLTMYGWYGKESTEDKEKSSKEVDIILLSFILHDIGKIYEMNRGIYQPVSVNTHREIGLEIIFPHKERIVSLYGERGWVMIVSVILGHHDIYGDKARTIYARVAHLIDNIEAEMTGIGQELEVGLQSTPAGNIIRWRDGYLNV